MFKPPVPGAVKTRLVPPLTEAEAAGLYGCSIKDTFSRLGGLEDADIFASCTPISGHIEVAGLIPVDIPIFTQEGGDYGERLFNAIKTLVKRGYRGVAAIGSDTPDLPLEYIQEAFRTLDSTADEKQVVIGPSKSGGGYFLIAMKRVIDLFSGVPWGSGRVLELTMKKAGDNQIPVSFLHEWRSLETPHDLEVIARAGVAEKTADFIKALQKENRL